MSKYTKNKKFSAFSIKRIKSFLNNTDKIQISSDTKTLHNIRTDIKKLRSVFILTIMLDKKFKQSVIYRNNVTILKQIFRLAGRIREADLILIESDGKGISPELADKVKASVQKSMEIYRSEFTDLMIGFEKDSFIEIKKYYKKTDKRFKGKKILLTGLNLLSKEFQKIKLLTVITHSPENLHAIRKHLKNICTTGNFLHKINHNKGLALFLRICEKEEIKLGDWHDKIIFAEYLRDFLNLNVNKSNMTESKYFQINDKLNNELLDSLYNDLYNIFCNTYTKNQLKKFILSY